MMDLRFPFKVLKHIFSFIDSNEDRNSVSLVCKSWFETERRTRKRVFVGNCYAVNPATVAKRFPGMRSLTLKGKPHFADYNLVPDGWGGYAWPWIKAMATKIPSLEEIRLKRMVVTDECLEKIAASFKEFKVLVLTTCEGFSTDGLAAIAATCRNLSELELRDCIVDDLGGDWLSYFPETLTSLVSLDFSCLDSEVKLSDLERLVSRSPNLKSLKLNRAVTLEVLESLLRRAPQLVELGTGSFSDELNPGEVSKLTQAFSKLKQLKSLSGLWDLLPEYIPILYSVCPHLNLLNLSYATVQMPDLVELLSRCSKLQKLWVMDLIEDTGLKAVALCCKELRELRVFPSGADLDETNVALTEQGLVSVSEGCRKLESVLYFCAQFTNAALVTIARNRPNLRCFRLCVMEPFAPDYKTQQPLDEGFKAIVQRCKDLQRLSVSGLLTDKAFEYIGIHAKKLRMLSIAFAGDSDLMLHHLLSGCKSLKKLEIRDCPFGDTALLENAAKLETMRSLWMSSCFVSFGACKLLSQKMPKLNVEVIDEHPPKIRPESSPVERIYIYRTVAGPRLDTPDFVWTIHKNPEVRVSRLALRNLKELELRDCIVDDLGGDWLSYFPETLTSLVSLDFSCLDSEVKLSDLERLVSRSPNLKSLKLNRAVTLDVLESLLCRAPQLVELGTGSFSDELNPGEVSKLTQAFSKMKQLKSLSGLWDVLPEYIPILYSVCPRLTSLNLSYATVQMHDLVELLSRCSKLQKLWVMDLIEDTGLKAVALCCKELRELRVFPSGADLDETNVALTEQGLVSVSEGCRKLESVLYFCVQFTNAALVTIARNRPNLRCFRLCVMEPFAPDYRTQQPLDEGFKAIVQRCKDLQRLSVSGLLTDKAFEYIGIHSKKLRMLSIAFAGDSDLMLHHLLSGCKSLKKLEIRDCPFGDTALLENAAKLETMRSLWMSSCFVSFGACKLLSQKMPKLNVEVIDEHPPKTRPDSSPVERIYIYRTVAGPRLDTPDFVWTIHKNPEVRVSRLAIR